MHREILCLVQMSTTRQRIDNRHRHTTANPSPRTIKVGLSRRIKSSALFGLAPGKWCLMVSVRTVRPFTQQQTRPIADRCRSSLEATAVLFLPFTLLFVLFVCAAAQQYHTCGRPLLRYDTSIIAIYEYVHQKVLRLGTE